MRFALSELPLFHCTCRWLIAFSVRGRGRASGTTWVPSLALGKDRCLFAWCCWGSAPGGGVRQLLFVHWAVIGAESPAAVVASVPGGASARLLTAVRQIIFLRKEQRQPAAEGLQVQLRCAGGWCAVRELTVLPTVRGRSAFCMIFPLVVFCASIWGAPTVLFMLLSRGVCGDAADIAGVFAVIDGGLHEDH